MTDNRRKPKPKSQKEISKGLQTPYNVDGMNGGLLQNPNDSEINLDARSSHQSFRGDTSKPFSVSLYDIDEAILYYINNIIKPSVTQNGEKLEVPIMYGNSERWKQIQKDGYLRDKNNKILLPLIVFERTNIEANRNITNKIDANNPHNYGIFTKNYSKKNAYDNFSVLTNRTPEKEYHAIVIPDYITLTYEFIISTHSVNHMNAIIEAINYASDSYWGDPERFKFKANIDSFASSVELPVDGKRVVKSTFTLKIYGYIVPKTLQKDLNSIKKFNNKTQVIFGLETVKSFDSSTTITPPSFINSNTIFPGNNSCAPVTIYRNGVLYQTIEAGGSFSYDTGSGNPIDIYLNSQLLLEDQSSDVYIGIKNTLGNDVGGNDYPNWLIETSQIYTNNQLYTASAAETNAYITITNNNSSSVGYISESHFRIRDTYILFNFSAATGAKAETTKSIEVINFNDGDPIGTKITDTPTTMTIRIKNTYISNSLGTYTASIQAEKTGSIPNTYVNIYNDTGSLIQTSSLASCTTGSITLSSSIIYIRPMNTGVSASFLYYDDYWIQINRPDPYIPPLVGIPAFLDKNVNYLLRYNNIFGHKYRLTGISGGYYDYLDNQYKLVDGTVSNQATTFGTAASQTSYLIDHYTGLGWKWNVEGSKIWATHASASISSSHAGYTDWYMPNINELMSLHDFSQVMTSLFPPFNGTIIKSSTPYKGLETTQHFIKNTFTMANQADGTAGQTYFCRRHFI